MRLTICLLCLALFSCSFVSASADTISQQPKTGISYSFASDYDTGVFIGTADDFVGNGQKMAAIKWWGSCWLTASPSSISVYSDGLYGAPATGITEFGISILGHSGPTATMPFDHPDFVAVADWRVPIAAVTQSPAFTVTKSTSPLVTEDVWQYSVDLSNPLVNGASLFIPQAGTRYWMMISAFLDDGSRQWGWHEGDGHWGAYAVQTVQGNGVGWYIPCGGHDMAFEITTVPEPGTMMAMASGLACLVGSTGRKRKYPRRLTAHQGSCKSRR